MRADAPDHRLAKCAICINTYELPKGRHLGAGIETECEAGPMADPIALGEGISWPLDAVRMQILDADGREVHERETLKLLEPYRSRIAIGCHERRLKTHAHSYRQPAEVTLASFLSCVRIDLLRTHCAELNGSTAIFVNVTVGSDRDDNAAVPSISGSAGFYAGAGRHSESCRRGLRLRAQGRGKNLGIAVTK